METMELAMRRRDFLKLIGGMAATGPVSAWAQSSGGGTPIKIEVIPPGIRKKKSEADEQDEIIGDVFVTWNNGRREQLTHGAHARAAKISSDGLIGWTWSDARVRGNWLATTLRVQRGRQRLIDVKSEAPFIEDWGFASEGVVVKSRAMHGPSRIELFSTSNGKRLQVIDGFDEEKVPSWAKPFVDR